MKKIILTLLTITLLFTPYMNIYAAENISIEGSHNIQVYADVTSTFEITSPLFPNDVYEYVLNP